MNQMVKRIIMSVLGVVICGISVGMFKFAALGIDPFQSLMSGLDAVIPIRFGTLYIIVNVVLLLFALIFDRKKIGIATFINLFLLGYIVEFSQGLCERLMPDAPLWLRVVILLIAIVILCLSSAKAEQAPVCLLPRHLRLCVRGDRRGAAAVLGSEHHRDLRLGRRRHHHHRVLYGTADHVL